MKRTLKRAMASLTAAAIACTSMVVTSFATNVTMSLEDEFTLDCTATATSGNIYQISMSDWDVPSGYYLSNVSFNAVAEYDAGENGDTWNGGGGSVALNFDSTGTWYDKAEFSLSWSDSEGQAVSVDIPYTFENVVDEETEETVTVEQDIEGAISSEGGIIQFGWWWSTTDTTLDISDIVLTFSLIEKDIEPEEPVVPEEPSTPDGVVGYTGSIDIEAAGGYWDEVELTKAQLVGGNYGTRIVSVVFESENNFGIGYNSTTSGTWFSTNDTDGYYEAADINFNNFSMKLIGRSESGISTISWTVYVTELTETLVSDITSGDEFVMGSSELYSLNLFEVGTGNPADVTSVIFDVTMTDSAWDWATAILYTNGDNGTDEVPGWQQIVIGAPAHYEEGYSGACIEETYVTQSFEVPIYTNYWYQVGVKEVNGTFDINSITFMAGDEVYYTMETLPLGEKLNGTSASIEDGVIGLNFFMSFGEDVLADEGAMLYITFADGTTEAWTISDGEETENGYKYPVYVDAKEMADDVTIQVTMSDGTVGKEYTQSVKAYANEILSAEAGTYTDETIALVKAMLVYGGYAQTYFEYNTENLASEGLDTDVSSATVNKIFAKYKEGTLPEGVEYIGSALVLNGTTKIRHFFTATDVSQLPEGYLQQGDYYYYRIENIYADGLGGMYTTTIGEWSIEYSALSYARAVINNSDNYSEELVNLVKAMVKLYEAAKAA